MVGRSTVRRILAAVLVAVVLNSVLWPIAWGVLYAVTGMEESPLLSIDTPYGKAFHRILPLLFLVSCFAVAWRQLARERQRAGRHKPDETGAVGEPGVPSRSVPDANSQ